MNKKGLASGLLAVIIVLFLFALMSLVSLAGWNFFYSQIEVVNNESISQPVKDDISELGVFLGWGDTIFVFLFIALLIGYMVTSFSLNTDKTIYIFLFFIFLIFSSIIAMVVSNGWAFLTEFAFLQAAAADLPFTNWFMQYLPIITFFMGLIGGVIFYARKRNNPSGDSFNIDFPPNTGGDQFE